MINKEKVEELGEIKSLVEPLLTNESNTKENKIMISSDSASFELDSEKFLDAEEKLFSIDSINEKNVSSGKKVESNGNILETASAFKILFSDVKTQRDQFWRGKQNKKNSSQKDKVLRKASKRATVKILKIDQRNSQKLKEKPSSVSYITKLKKRTKSSRMNQVAQPQVKMTLVTTRDGYEKKDPPWLNIII